MFKLVVIGGKLRGKEFPLSEGENTIGRDAGNNVPLPLDGISKNHLKITVTKDAAYLEDLNSANGTLVNKKIVKKMTLSNGDQVALPNVIMQIVFVVEKKIIIKKKVLKQNNKGEDDSAVEEVPDMPSSPVGKVLHIFKFKLMPVFYTFNKEYEWRVLIGVTLVIFIISTITLTIFPVLIDNKSVLMTEIGIRGFHYAEDVARLNALAMQRKNFDSINTKFLETESGVDSYELFDTEGRIIQPLGKLNEYITDSFSIQAKEEAAKGKEKISKNIGDGMYGIAKPIQAFNVKTGVEENVGVIAIKFAPASLVKEAANNSKAYMEAFATSSAVAVIFFAVIYFLTVKHLDDLRFQIDQVIRGKQKEITPKFQFQEIKPLIGTMNTVLQKYQESQGMASATEGEIEEDGKYVGILKEFMLGANGPTVILNSEKLIQNVNPLAEDLIGIRESVGANMSLLDVARDQGFAATVIDLCDQSANNSGVCQKGNYEFQGHAHEICVTALMGKDNFAKAFYITFVKDRS
ncbi:MAG: FHA domain-containing protein [Oligoflexia bacterium]|nr:FHA domain-containing protein [Oligoflexia bacterium]